MAVKCPACGFTVGELYKCDHCGDVRCGSSLSSGPKGSCGSNKSPYGRSEAAHKNGQCHVCHKGKYQKV